MKVLGYINTWGRKLSPETKSRMIICSQSVLITLTHSSKGSMFFYYTECLMIQVCIMLLEGQLLKK
jgi:hypothetical protein